MLENIRNFLQSQTVPHITVEGHDSVTKIAYVGPIEKRTNSIINLFDLLGYEIKSNTIEIFNGKKYIGRGYLADVAGITVDISRVMPAPDPDRAAPEIPPAPGGLSILGNGILGAVRPELKDQAFRMAPCVVLQGDKRIQSVRFFYLREIDGAIIDDEKQIRYDIRPETRIEITMPDGKTDLGYVCDPSGQTIRITRQITVLGKPDKDGKQIEVGIRFSGRIGKLAASDRISKLMTPISGRENLWQLLVVALIANIIGVVLHI